MSNSLEVKKSVRGMEGEEGGDKLIQIFQKWKKWHPFMQEECGFAQFRGT